MKKILLWGFLLTFVLSALAKDSKPNQQDQEKLSEIEIQDWMIFFSSGGLDSSVPYYKVWKGETVLKVEFVQPQGNVTVEVSDASGQVWICRTVDSDFTTTTELDITSLPQGEYVITLSGVRVQGGIFQVD